MKNKKKKRFILTIIFSPTTVACSFPNRHHFSVFFLVKRHIFVPPAKEFKEY